jgi:flagellar biosynthetic protein FliR
VLTVTTAQLEAWIAAALWPFLRMLALFSAAPVLSHRALPRRARVALAALVTILVAPTLPAPAAVPLLSGAALLTLAQQLLVGLALGFCVRLAFAAVELAGDLIGLQMGLSFAVFFDPQSSEQTPLVGTFLGMVATLLFLAIDGPAQTIAALVETFRVVPVGDSFHSALRWEAIAGLASAMFAMGLHLSLPVLAAMLACNIALGVMARAAPQLNLFSIGFPITLLTGIGALALFLGSMASPIRGILEAGLAAWLR